MCFLKNYLLSKYYEFFNSIPILIMHVPNTHIAITNGRATLGKFGLAIGIWGLVVGKELGAA